MEKTFDLIIRLTTPITTQLIETIDSDVIEKKGLFTGYCPFGSQPDILFVENIFCGLSYNVPLNFVKNVQQWCKFLNSTRVQIIDASQVNMYEDKSSFPGKHYLQILWTDQEPEGVILAALCEDLWLYSHQPNDNLNEIFGVILSSAVSIGEDCGLVIPSFDEAGTFADV